MDELLGRVAGRFGRVKTRRGFAASLTGMLAQLPGTNCWSIAEHVGHATPDLMQHLLGRAVWDTDGVTANVCPEEGLVHGRGADLGALATTPPTTRPDSPYRRRSTT